MTIKVTYNVTDVYMSQSVSPVYINVSYSDGGTSGGGVWGTITGTLSNQTDLQTALDLKVDESTIDGGTEGQILSKASGTDFDFAWINNYAKYLATNVRNQTGSTIGAFQVVYISGATGNKPLISLADADTEATSSKTYGVTASSIANNGTGDVVTVGELSGIDTSAFNEGDLLWLSTTAGGVVTSPPAEPAHAVFIGYVVRSHPTLGTIDVSIQNGYELNELHGVQITTPTDNQGLFYNSTSTLWENKSIATALGFTPANAATTLTINGVTYDLSTSRTWTVAAGISGSGAAGQVTYWTGASAVSGSNNLFWDNTNGRLGIGTNAPAVLLDVNGATTIRGVTNITYATPILNINVTANTQTSAINFNATDGTPRASITTNIASGEVRYFVGSGGYFATHYSNGSERMRLHSNGNFSIGTTSDLGVRLGVVGDTLLRGSGATSATTALTVQNSSSQNILRVLNNGEFRIGNASNYVLAFPYSTVYDTSDINGTNISIYPLNGSISLGGGTQAPTSSNANNVITKGRFQPTSGTATFADIRCEPLINQIGGANGITRGLYVNPTLTAAADFRAIETTAGNVLFGSNFFWDNANGRLGIGTNAPTTALTVNGNAFFGGANPAIFMNGSAINQTALISNANGNIASLVLRCAQIKFEDGNSVQKLLLSTTGNLLLQNGGTFTDNGQRLQVYGDTLLRGSGATSATTALTVQNSSLTEILVARNDGLVYSRGTNFWFSAETATSSISNGSFITGYRNVATGNFSFAAGGGMAGIGGRNQALGNMSAAFGRNSIAYLTGQFAHSSYGVGEGRSQHSFLQLFADITGTSISELFINGATLRATLPVSNSMWNAKIYVLAVCTTAGGTTVLGDIYSGEYLANIKKIGAVTSLVGSVSSDTKSDSSMMTSVVTIDADNTNSSLRIQFTPPTTASSTTVIRVLATLHLTEIRY